MALKPIVDSVDDLPEAIRALYVKDEEEGATKGKFRLDVAGMVPKARLDEFRENNVKLQEQARKLAEQFADVDPDEYRKLKEAATKGTKRKAGETDDDLDARIEAAVEDRIKGMRKKHTTELEAEQTRYKQTRSRLERELIDRAITSAAVATGAVETALDDIVSRARGTFKLDEHDRVIPVGDDGKVLYGADGEPLSMKEFMQTLATKAPHLFKQSSGGGASKGNGNAGPGGVRYKSDLKTPAEKAAWIAANPGKYESLPLRPPAA